MLKVDESQEKINDFYHKEQSHVSLSIKDQVVEAYTPQPRGNFYQAEDNAFKIQISADDSIAEDENMKLEFVDDSPVKEKETNEEYASNNPFFDQR